ncbi:ribonuclease E/G [Aquamicrobium sp. LC103]|uniref:Rne/Rng family ribonuclease n=1 Tax=Aquamicrobium sp. LC103 TaxID=1120658 RepID=UPI00063EC97C|nr:ribonuclease E/G [Aquamicrobium sp. LC103]TKT79209.1 ribonuclease E/G [Aquamicrobium sp. LC103]
MPNKMLIDASHPEETRVVVVRGNRIEEFDFESQDKKQLKGNIYLARVTRVEPSLQAAFVEYGGNRHGFLAFSEIHPDYYQIPVADRQALLRAEEEAAAAEDEDSDESEERGRNRRRRRGNRSRGGRGDEKRADASSDAEDGAEASEDGTHDDDGGSVMAEAVDADVIAEDVGEGRGSDDADDAGGEDANGAGGDDGEVESVGAGDAMEEVRDRRKPPRRHYKIQEVIKRRQILLVQVVKEERGNKGAALTTYLSLAGRYSVLMPNTARGGGISRKITNAQDRKRLKDVVKDLEVPQGMGVILRTAGESRTKAEIKRDYEYLMRMWENVRNLTLQSTAPALVYEEGSLIKRSVRDLYNKDIDEILVAGEDGYREAKDFMRMLMPSHAKVVQPYRDKAPIFARNGIEAQLDRMLQPQVTLKSGGYIIINQTEALVAIDVNSGRSTKEHSIEDTALQTNLEAAEEVARQLRLRDMAGLIVIDFIDMEENRNNRSVEKKLKDCLKNDRARIQVGRISHFGLLEMSRQRIRASVLESTMQPCPHCGGTGHVRSESSVALLVVRAIEEFLLKDNRNHITVRTPTSTAIYVLNHKRSMLAELEARFGLTITVEADDTVRSQHYAIFKGAPVERPVTIEAPSISVADLDDDLVEDEEVPAEEADEAESHVEQPRGGDDGEGQRKRRRRRRRRGGRDRDREQQAPGEAAPVEDAAADTDGDEDADENDAEAFADDDANGNDGSRKKRRRGKRGGRRNRRDEEDAEQEAGAVAEAAEAEVIAETVSAEVPNVDEAAMAAVEQASSVVETSTGDASAEEAPEAEAVAEEPKAKKPRRTTKRAKKEPEPEVVEAEAALATPEPEAPEAEAPAVKKKAAPKRAPRRKAAAAETESETSSEPAAPVDAGEQVADAEAEPVVVSSDAAAGSDEPKQRKTGWWQRKGFF